MTKIFDWKENNNKKQMQEVVETLKNEGLVILPTETVYGLAANAFSDAACIKIFKASTLFSNPSINSTFP